MAVLKLLGLMIALNLLRYYPLGYLEALWLGPMFDIMAANPGYFNNEFTTSLWVTSYFYNFVMWAVIVLAYHLFNRQLPGNAYLKSLQVFGLMWLFFAAVSAIYMNHYSHPRAFYLWNIADALLIYGCVALINGFLHPRLFPEQQADNA